MSKLVWDLATGRPLPEPVGESVMARRALARDGRSYVGVVGLLRGGMQGEGHREFARVDLVTGEVRDRLPYRLGKYLVDLKWVDDDRSVRAWTEDDEGNIEMLTWDLATRAESRRTIPRPVVTSGQPGACYGLGAGTPDGRLLALDSLPSRRVQLWDFDQDRASGELLQAPGDQTCPRMSALFTPDGRTLILGRDDGQLEVWDVTRRSLIRLVRLHPHGLAPEKVTLLPDGQTILSVSSQPQTRPPLFPWIWRTFPALDSLWPYPTNEAVVLDLATGRVLARTRDVVWADLAPDGRTVLTCHRNGRLAVRPMPEPPPGR